MLIGIIYFFVTLIVISIGAIAGISGGVVLRPIFDAIDYHDPLSIAFYMGVAVLTMSVSSTIKQITMGTKINLQKVFALATGAFVGGILGQLIMDAILYQVGEGELQIIQGILSIVSLIFVFIFTRENGKTRDFKSMFWYILIGLGLGTFATLLAIGGGPINVIVFVIFFGITLKEATVYSITTIFFAQVARLGAIGLEHGFSGFGLSTLFFIIPAAIIGGIIGGRMNVILSETSVMRVFKFVVMGTILLNTYNVARMILN